MEFPKLLRGLLNGRNLSEEESSQAFGAIMDAQWTAAQSAAFLTAMAVRGESVDEVTGAARAMRARSLHVEHNLPAVLDVCGTGGDGANTINISTIVALIVASCDVPVAKHGNRAASSSCGSADVLEMEGLRLDVSPQGAARMLESLNFTFMFAPAYHPAMRNVAPVRRELGVRTVFNILGPLTNPANATHQVIGVARESQLELVGDVLQRLGTVAGAIIHGSGVDEIVGDRPCLVYAYNNDRGQRWILDPKIYGVDVPLAQIRAESSQECSDAFRRVLEGENSGRAEVAFLNAGFALHVFGKTKDITDGMELAREVVREGKAAELFERIKAFADE